MGLCNNGLCDYGVGGGGLICREVLHDCYNMV